MCLIIGTLFLKRTTLAFRLSRGALISSEENKRMMKYFLLLDRKKSIDCSIGRFWSFCLHDSKTVHHSMDMSIDADIGHIIKYR